MSEEIDCELCYDGTFDIWECPSCSRKIVESRPALENHCKNCCCAKSWEALGIKEYNGLSIPENILKLKEVIASRPEPRQDWDKDEA